MHNLQKVLLALGYLFGFTLLYLGVLLIIQSGKNDIRSTPTANAELNFYIGDNIMFDRNIWTSQNQDEMNRTGNFSRITVTRNGGSMPQRVNETSIVIPPFAGPSGDSDH